MSPNPILLMGGTGSIGRQTARSLRAVHPDVLLLIGGRDLATAKEAAAEIGHAEGVQINPTSDDLSLGDRSVSAIAIFYMDHATAGLRFAQTRRIPHLGISSGVFEIAPEIATYMHKPDAAPVVLGYEWLVGAATIPTLELAKAFSRVQDIAIGALVDEQDTGGPSVAVDFAHLNKMMPAALTRINGNYVWRDGEGAKARFRAVDGTEIEAIGFSSIDVVGLAAATGALNVRFDLATGVSSTRRIGEPMSTEILIELVGEDHTGRPLRTRHAVVHRQGAVPLTGLGVSMLLERLVGLDGNSPTPPGLYFPYQVIDPAAYLARLEQTGGSVVKLTQS